MSPDPDDVSAGLCVELRARRAVRAGRPGEPSGASLPLGDNGAPSRGTAAFMHWAPRARLWSQARSTLVSCCPPDGSQTISSGSTWPKLPPAMLRRKFSSLEKASPVSTTLHSITEAERRAAAIPVDDRLNSPSLPLAGDSHFCWVIRKALIENWVRLTTYQVSSREGSHFFSSSGFTALSFEARIKPVRGVHWFGWGSDTSLLPAAPTTR